MQPVLVNKILLEHSHIHLFKYYVWCFSSTKAEMNCCNRDHLAPNTRNVCYLALCGRWVVSLSRARTRMRRVRHLPKVQNLKGALKNSRLSDILCNI